MSTKYTKNYKLCQWEATDQVRRTDFNTDNAKLETALTRIETTADSAKAAAKAAQTTADAAWSPAQPYIALGNYIGNAETSRDIELGFRPRVVIVCMSSGAMMSNGPYSGHFMIYGGIATEEVGCGGAIRVTDTGFHLSFNNDTYQVNLPNRSYTYVAFR